MLTAKKISEAIPNCPGCGGCRYDSVTENVGNSFRLKSLRCHHCECDILKAFLHLPSSSDAQKFSPLLFAFLASLALVEAVFLVELVLTE